MRTEYTIVLACILSVPFVLSFTKRLGLYRNIGRLVFTLLIVSIPFWIWDIIATANGHWSFNPNYILGIVVLGLPIEEWFFFLVIAFVSVFTWESIKHLRRGAR